MPVLLPAVAVGLLCVAVLNVNNIRDMVTDAANRRTVALRLGDHRARIYQTVLICTGLLCMLAFSFLGQTSAWHFLWILSLPGFVLHLRGVWNRSGRALDPMLPLLVMSTFTLSVLTVVGLLI